MEEQVKIFGTDHVYGMDLFNEVEAPSWDPATLAAMSKGAYDSMADVDPDALWLQMGWMFYYDQRHWTAIHNIRYDNKTLIRAWKKLLALDSDRDTYRFDVVNFGTQALGNHFAELRDQFTAAYRSHDLEEAERVGASMLELIDYIDALAAFEQQLRLDRWLDDADA